ncbi:hypothetical protein Sste5346_008584 [Sporothrix stenoceras]|uniref:PKD/Chitinase domain-containing protein n=1 Tax=Sporothrix stenoceras TaxID=5173 RepID=A0ABR3YNH6_9PEZI
MASVLSGDRDNVPSASDIIPEFTPPDPAQSGSNVITADTVDPTYSSPVVDAEVDEAEPTPHRRVAGHFEGTDIDFNIYLPPSQHWHGRFFQLAYPVQQSTALPRNIVAALDGGAYFLQVKGAIGGFRADAAAAKFSKTVAAKYYGDASRRIYGYIYGGSGGSYVTVGAMEGSTGVWDGGVPIVIGSPGGNPQNLSVRALANLVLQSKADDIADALRPGGSGDPYASLSPLQRMVLQEATDMGLPLQGWEHPRAMSDLEIIMIMTPTVRMIDPTYSQDFWTQPGYLGTEQSELGDLLRARLVDCNPTIDRCDRDTSDDTIYIVLNSLPDTFHADGVEITLYGQDMTTEVGPLHGTVDAATKTLALPTARNAAVLEQLQIGRRVHLDNRWFLAMHTHHRHQLPSERISGFNQFYSADSADSTPKHPQRPIVASEIIAMATTGGSPFTGKLLAKTIIIDNLYDVHAFPYQAACYRDRIQQALQDRLDDNVRIYMNDHASHFSTLTDADDTKYLIEYEGIVQQALRDLANWVENGISPPASTNYTIKDSQVLLPKTASERKGMQVVVSLAVDGGKRINTTVEQPVKLVASLGVPPGTGQLVDVAWDTHGTGSFTSGTFTSSDKGSTAEMTVKYTTPGTFFAAVRATSHRGGNSNAVACHISNLDRVRIVVE